MDNRYDVSGFMVCRVYPPHVQITWIEEVEEMGHAIPAHYAVRFYTSEGQHCFWHMNMPPEFLESFRMTFNLACDQAWDDRREASMKTGVTK